MNKVEVTIRATLDQAGKVEWNDDEVKFIPSNSGAKNGKVIHIVDPAPAELIFDLHDDTGLKLQFERDPTQAIWIQPGTVCPAGPGDGRGEFTIDPPQARKLRVVDRHSTNHEYCYALRFTSTRGPEKFDPIIKN